jgi:hypothetical protein
MNKYGINARGLIRAVERLTREKIDLKDDELLLPLQVRSTLDKSGKAEDL